MSNKKRKVDNSFKLSKKEHSLVREGTVRTILDMSDSKLNIFLSKPELKINDFIDIIYKASLDILIKNFPKFTGIDPSILNIEVRKVIKYVLGQLPREIEALGLVSRDINNRSKLVLDAWRSIKGKALEAKQLDRQAIDPSYREPTTLKIIKKSDIFYLPTSQIGSGAFGYVSKNKHLRCKRV